MTEHPSDEPRPALPATMALAWGVVGRPSRGPKRALTITQIARAGIEIAAADGLSAVSMARVADRAGVSTMALYRYVAGKDDLLEIMVDVALGPPPPIVAGDAWRAGLLGWARAVRDAYRANAWAMRVPITGPPMGPNNTRWLEHALTVLAGTPLTYQQKFSAVITLTGFVRSAELLLADLLAGQAAGRDPGDYAKALRHLVDPVEFPQLTQAMVAGAVDDGNDGAGVDDDFDFGVDVILDGIEALVARQRTRR